MHSAPETAKNERNSNERLSCLHTVLGNRRGCLTDNERLWIERFFEWLNGEEDNWLAGKVGRREQFDDRNYGTVNVKRHGWLDNCNHFHFAHCEHFHFAHCEHFHFAPCEHLHA